MALRDHYGKDKGKSAEHAGKGKSGATERPAEHDAQSGAEDIFTRHARERDETNGRHEEARKTIHKLHEKEHADLAGRHAQELAALQTAQQTTAGTQQTQPADAATAAPGATSAPRTPATAVPAGLSALPQGGVQ